jgi:hypothetical protein
MTLPPRQRRRGHTIDAVIFQKMGLCVLFSEGYFIGLSPGDFPYLDVVRF